MKYLKFYESWILKPEQVNDAFNSTNHVSDTMRANLDKRYEDRYADEEDSFDEVIGVLESKCKPFLDELRKSKQYPLFRGARFVTGVVPGLYHRTAHKDRRPTDMDKDISKFFDDNFKEKFGVAIRSNGVFASKCPIVSNDYGTGYLFFPIGEYKYYWSPFINDLYGDCQYETWYYDYTTESAWEEKYGEDQEGSWSINGIEYTSSQSDSVRSAKESDDSLKGMSTTKVCNLLVWVPDVSYDDFLKKTEATAKKEVARIANFYQEGSLVDIKKQEITFICDEYFLVDAAFYSNFLKYLGLESN